MNIFSHAGTICKLYVYTNSFTDKNSYFKIILSCFYKKECYIIKQLLTIESLNMM